MGTSGNCEDCAKRKMSEDRKDSAIMVGMLVAFVGSAFPITIWNLVAIPIGFALGYLLEVRRQHRYQGKAVIFDPED